MGQILDFEEKEGWEESVEGLRQMVLSKLENGELDRATLDSVMEEIYNIAHYLGTHRGKLTAELGYIEPRENGLKG